jgi:pimeloyl-ACP methyl ester carboxylesterase
VVNTDARLSPAVRKLYPWKGEFFEHPDGLKQHYLDVGERDGETLLFVHGNPTWSFYWRTLIAPLVEDGYRCVAVDHIGCGLSDKPQDWSYILDNHIANLERLIEHLDLTNVTVFVHDWGGAIGFSTAARMTHRIKRFVVFNTLCEFGDFPLIIKSCRWPVVSPLAVRGMNMFLKLAMKHGTSKPLDFKGPIGEGYLAPYGSWDNRVAIHRFIQDIPIEKGHPTWKHRVDLPLAVAKFRDTPTLVIWGNQDFVFHHGFRDGWRRAIPNCEYHEFDDANHFVVEDAHERIVPLVREFLRPGSTTSPDAGSADE